MTTTQVERPGVLALSMVPRLLVGLALLPGIVAAQDRGAGPLGPPAGASQGHVWYTLARVTTLAGSPVPGAKAAVFLDAGQTPVQQFKTGYQGEFEISLRTDLDKGHRIKVVATKDGYLDAMEILDLTAESRPDVLDLVLRENQEDSGQLPLGALISGVGERLQMSAGGSPAGNERRDTVRGAEALLDKQDSDGALRLLATAVEREPNCVEFRTLEGLAMLKAGSWSGGARLLTETAALNASLDARSRRSEPNLILGVLECWRGNLQRADELFFEALDVEPNNPLLLQELGRAYLLQQNWSGADMSLARAVQAGAYPEARLLRAEALLAEAKPADAQAEMRTYLAGRKPKDLPKFTRMLWIELTQRLELETESEADASKSVVKQTPEELLEALPELKGLEPTKSQEELPSILQKAGERAEAFFRDFHNTISREDIRQETLNRNGKLSSSLSQNFQYLLLNWPDKSRPALEEYRKEVRRAQLLPGASEQDFMLTQGFASTSVLLLPAYQPETTFTYLGRQRMDGYDTFVIAFAQRPEVARLQIEFRAGQAAVEALSQGVVWIDSNTYQIIRMRTDLLHPLAKARLDRETTEIRYSEVRFQDAPVSFWLPRDVVVTVDWKGKFLRNRHSYSDFHLFNVQSRIIAAPEPAEGP